MRPSLRWLGAVGVVLALAVSGCADDDIGGAEQSLNVDIGFTGVERGCESAPGHPKRAPVEARGFVVACVSDDNTSLHVRNDSAHVLRVSAASGVYKIEDAGVDTAVGEQAALATTGSGWTASGTHYVLPLGGALVARGNSPTVRVEPDMTRTVVGNVARSMVNWMVSRVPLRGRALYQQVQDCATTAAELAQPYAYIEDILRDALGTFTCVRTLTKAILDAGDEPTIHLPRARSAILKSARPLAEDRLISFVARVFPR
jgi:hypothetical protein